MSETSPKRPKPHHSLSARLLVLTVFFVMLAELFIYTPSVARYRKSYLEERIVRARLASLAVETMPQQAEDKKLGHILLRNSDSYAIMLSYEGRRVMIAGRDMPPEVDATFDLRANTFFGWIRDAFATLAQQENRVIRIIGEDPKMPKIQVEVLMDETPMRQDMYDYSQRILNLSIVISLFTAMLLYASLQWLMVRPLRGVTRSMERFRAAPEDENRIIQVSGREDEIGVAQRELAVMQRELRLALRQKDRLAMLGAAVTKVNHDLRNSLATAMLVGDRLTASEDPEVQRLIPRMFKAMDRAVSLCSQTLDYASVSAVGHGVKVNIREVVDTAAGTITTEAQAAGPEKFVWRNEVPADAEASIDAGQFNRVFENLGRNARQAGAGGLTVTAVREGGQIVIDVADDGPGLPEKAREHLFEPFAGSARDGGTGLGLVIAREVVRAHGGNFDLAETSSAGTRFRITLPVI